MRTVTLLVHDAEHLLGTFLDETHYDTLIDEDCDVYAKGLLSAEGPGTIVLKFRKNYFTRAQQDGAYQGLKEAAQQSQNRGLAAGPKGAKCLNRDWLTAEQAAILDFLMQVQGPVTPDDLDVIRARAKTQVDTRDSVWLGEKKAFHRFDWNDWLDGIDLDNPGELRRQAQWVRETLISDTTYANPVVSGIAGSFGRYPRIPWARRTAYTQKNWGLFEKSFPFLEGLSKAFRDLLPRQWTEQARCAAKLDQFFVIPHTVFTTITVNRNFRTAAHRDAGDLTVGFSNLTVVAGEGGGDYTGGHLVLPELRAAVAIRPGDLLLVNNHEFIHANTPILTKDGVELERISLVCYFREDLLEAGSHEYEEARCAFVESRRKNESHPDWRPGWNGVGTGMWESREWHEFLERIDPELVIKYHPESLVDRSGLEELFG